MGININFGNTTQDIVTEKLKSPFWKSFIFSWLTWNWKVWYITFFVSENIIKNKYDYLINIYSQNFFNLNYLLIILLNWIIAPIIISILIHFFITPYITHIFLDKEYEHELKEQKIKDKYLEKEGELLEKEEKIIEKKKKLEVSKYENWEAEYQTLGNLFLQSLSDFIYNCGGKVNGMTLQTLNIETDELSNHVRRYDSLGLIEKDKNNSKSYDVYNITEKGKYFLKNYTYNEKHK